MIGISNNTVSSLLPTLIKICKDLNLNEMEIALWSLHIESSKWNLEIFKLTDCLLFSAIIAKQQLSIDPKIAGMYILNLDMPTLNNYQKWNLEYPIRPNFDAPYINFQFSLLRNVRIF